MPGSKYEAVEYGVLDTVDGNWLGDNYGPLTYEGFSTARIAARLIETQVFGDCSLKRYLAAPLPEHLEFQRQREIPTALDPVAAMRRLSGDTQ